MEDANIFINYINNHYDELKRKYKNFCIEKQYQWDEDIFSDTILSCYSAIEKKGKLNDTTDQGIENYFFKSFKMNIHRDKQYARNCKRDLNYTTDEVNLLYEDWYNRNSDSSRTKLINDLFTDFSILYIMMKVEENFNNEHFHLFKLKTLCGYTYKQLYSKTNIKGARQKVLDVMAWIKANVKKEEVKDAFYVIYGMYI